MKNLKVFLLFIVSLLLVYSLKAQTVDEIIDKYADALGGRANVTALKATKTIGSISMMGMDFPFTLYAIYPDKSYLEVSVQGMLMKQGFDGTSGWSVNPMTGSSSPEKVDDETAKSFKVRAKIISPLITYKEDGAKVELLENTKLNGKDVFKIKYTNSDNDVTTYYVDAENYLVVRSDKKVKQMGKELDSETSYSNFRKVGEINMPFMMETKTSESKMGSQIMILDKIEINPTIEDAVFQMPAK